MSFYNGEKPIRQAHGRVLAAAFPQALEFWRFCETTDGLWEAIRWVKQRLAASDGLGFYNYTQHTLTVAFLLARAGRYDEAVRELEDNMSDFMPAPAREKLLKMVSEPKPPSNAAR